ncbi:MAG: Maf family protein [Candidatus Pacebacteria bacterium]|nr:Maf family protein [Candidatus Paceibacterota bacterium]
MTDKMTPIILASASAIRAHLLHQAGLDFTVIPARIDESAIKTEGLEVGVSAAAMAEKLAWMKALAVSRNHPHALVIGCDQMLEVEQNGPGIWLDKPTDLAQARQQILLLSGCEHSLYSAAVLVQDGQRLWSQCERVRLTMNRLSNAEIDHYLERAGVDLIHSVGAYQIEGLGIRLFSKIEGDYFAILGIPLLPMLKFLRESGRIEL